MKRTILTCISIMMLMVACQKEATQVSKPETNAKNITNIKHIKGVSVMKDGYPYPNIETSNSLSDGQIGWFLDLEEVSSGYSNTPKGPIVSNLGDASLYCGGISTVNLYAGQNILMGTITYANDATNLYITYTTNPDWYMSEIHLYVGALISVPLSGGGTPSPGRFPIKSTFTASTLSQSVTYTIPLSTLTSQTLVIAAHASVLRVDVDGDVVAKETAWAAGSRFTSSKNWATYVSATINQCTPIPEGDLNNNTSGSK